MSKISKKKNVGKASSTSNTFLHEGQMNQLNISTFSSSNTNIFKYFHARSDYEEEVEHIEEVNTGNEQELNVMDYA